ncbi:homocysteine S-methyltransferase family protein [Persicirhabdus sediminis]|uniref:Homocysteine S-methyltransferase family protein n=1 Tax=Persicirhabdus sediminis TaxID=454144 RepID=A0A8J7MH74_9BACT|nr:homocysteine S-methyltransferase family protein [Persicirhabdus sediminis]MBK1792811.1 homocysteine S-methyltransferase family protein [Persicirhabdus sediminis]
MQTFLTSYPLILGEAAIAERLRRLDGIQLDPMVFNTPFIYDDNLAELMADIHRQYYQVARDFLLPIMSTAPTWRIDAQRIQLAGLPESVNRDAVDFLIQLRERTRTEFPAQPEIKIGALIGPQNDCYQPQDAPAAADAEKFHRWQVEQLATTQADYLMAQTLPAVSEALGLAHAISQTDKPYILSFCIGPNGRILDGHSLADAIDQIDNSVSRPPLAYFVNCAYPSFLQQALADHQTENPSSPLSHRLIGMQANSSSLDQSQLDGAKQTQQDSLSDWGEQMLDLHRAGLRVLGGCCGTTDAHLNYIARHAKNHS